MHHVLEFVPYHRVRPASEYTTGPFRESRVTAEFAKEYGFSTVEIEKFPGGTLWQPSKGQLWASERLGPRKLYDIYDTPVALGGNTPTGDISGELIDVGNGGRAEDYAGKDVKGKVVMGSAGLNALQRMAVFERGAVGVLSWNSMRPIEQPDIMISSSIAAANPERRQPGLRLDGDDAHRARPRPTRLEKGEKITIRSVVEAQTYPGRQEVIHATIAGDGSTNQDVIVSGHIYEGLIKQGANDDNSGAAHILEMGRAYIQLVKEGKLPKPKRTIHFLFVQEISGTNAWLNAHPDVAKRIIADLNYDMEGLRLSTGGAQWLLMRTPDSFPSVPQRHLSELPRVRRRDHARARALSRQRLRAGARRALAQRQPRSVQHQGRQVLRLERSRDVHAARHSGHHLQHLAGPVVPLVAGHARQARPDAVQARRGREHRRDDGSRDAPTIRWRFASPPTRSAAAPSA